MKKLINKFTSRKFLAMIAGIATGIGLIISENITEGATTVITSIIAYLIAEGYIDAKAIKDAAEKSGDKNA